jgi:hypothetical protein
MVNRGMIPTARGARAESRARVLRECAGPKERPCVWWGAGAAEGDSLPPGGSVGKWDKDVTMWRAQTGRVQRNLR